DDVDPVALAVDEAAHLGIPASRLVAEVDPGLQQLLDAYRSHCLSPLSCVVLLPVGRVAIPASTLVRRAGQGREADPDRVVFGFRRVYATLSRKFSERPAFPGMRTGSPFPYLRGAGALRTGPPFP